MSKSIAEITVPKPALVVFTPSNPEISSMPASRIEVNEEDNDVGNEPIEDRRPQGFLKPARSQELPGTHLFSTHERMMASEPSSKVMDHLNENINGGGMIYTNLVASNQTMPNSGTDRKRIVRASAESSRRSYLDRRRGSFGQNLQLVQGQVVKKAMKSRNLIEFLRGCFLLTMFFIISYTSIAIIASIIANPLNPSEVNIWVKQFFHGLLLSALACMFLKVTIRNVLEKAEETEKKILLDR